MPAIHSLPAANVRSQSFYLARTHAQCRHCGKSTQLLALAMPSNHETLDPDIEAADESGGPALGAWEPANCNAFIFFVEYLPADIQRRLNRLSRHFRPAYSAETLNSYWANHCEYCAALQEDHPLHCEPAGAFTPSSEEAAANIELLQVPARFEASAAGYAVEPAFFGSMRKA